jgi:hypothetical protein
VSIALQPAALIKFGLPELVVIAVLLGLIVYARVRRR